jgi:hypothetical protein
MAFVNSKDDFQDRAQGHFSTSQSMKIHVNIKTTSNLFPFFVLTSFETFLAQIKLL